MLRLIGSRVSQCVTAAAGAGRWRSRRQRAPARAMSQRASKKPDGPAATEGDTGAQPAKELSHGASLLRLALTYRHAGAGTACSQQRHGTCTARIRPTWAPVQATVVSWAFRSPCLMSAAVSASRVADAAYKKFAMKGNKEHPLVSILVFVIGTLVGVSAQHTA